ncbi:unnamed protein product [Mycena citricolor]|uniref:RTA1-domain-containing protein n=1 Tax=Mycena citricolor TaxID=2018698 RepID=A0AAD2HLQ1_9AGAR|nr:unnamed protein product [Mycena citricolor]
MSRLARFLTFAACLASGFAAEVVQRDTTDTSVHVGGHAPSRTVASMALVVFVQSAVVSLIHFFWVRPYKPFMLNYTLGMLAMSAGFVLRSLDHSAPFQLWKFIAWDMLLLLGPCLFVLTDSFLFGHLIKTFDTDVLYRCLVISPSRVLPIFVGGELLNIMLLGAGGGLTVSQNDSLAKVGSKIAMVGFIFQALELVFFTYTLITFASRVANHYPQVWKPDNMEPLKLLSARPIENWRLLVYMIAFTSVGLTVRSIYRVAEFGAGYNSSVATRELFFYIFDAVPLAMTTSLFITLWPTRFLNARGQQSLRGGPSAQELKPQGFTPA